MKLQFAESKPVQSAIPSVRSEREREILQRIAAAIDPDIWTQDLPIPTRGHTEGFHQRRMDSIMVAVRVMDAIANDLKKEGD